MYAYTVNCVHVYVCMRVSVCETTKLCNLLTKSKETCTCI